MVGEFSLDNKYGSHSYPHVLHSQCSSLQELPVNKISKRSLRAEPQTMVHFKIRNPQYYGVRFSVH